MINPGCSTAVAKPLALCFAGIQTEKLWGRTGEEGNFVMGKLK